MFYISAKHVLGAFDVFCNKRVTNEFEPHESVKISYVRDKIPFENLPINASKIRDSSICDSLYKTPDISALRVDHRKLKNSINSIDIFLQDYFPSKYNLGEICIVGFPESAIIHNPGGGAIFPKASSFIIPKGEFSVMYNQIIKYGGKWVQDTINFAIRPFNKSLDSLSGYSGSPVFLKNNYSNEWVFIGIFSAVMDDKYLLVVKPKYVIRELEKAH